MSQNRLSVTLPATSGNNTRLVPEEDFFSDTPVTGSPCQQQQQSRVCDDGEDEEEDSIDQLLRRIGTDPDLDIGTALDTIDAVPSYTKRALDAVLRNEKVIGKPPRWYSKVDDEDPRNNNHKRTAFPMVGGVATFSPMALNFEPAPPPAAKNNSAEASAGRVASNAAASGSAKIRNKDQQQPSTPLQTGNMLSSTFPSRSSELANATTPFTTALDSTATFTSSGQAVKQQGPAATTQRSPSMLLASRSSVLESDASHQAHQNMIRNAILATFNSGIALLDSK